MTIRFLKDSIEFNEFTLRATPTGLQFDGEIAARQFYNLFQGTVAGFISGGNTPNPASPTTVLQLNTIQRFPFASDSPAAVVNNLSPTPNRAAHGAFSSSFDGYIAGGVAPPATYVSSMQKFPFTNYASFPATGIGNLSVAVAYQGSHSSATDGFSVGGQQAPSAAWNAIEKFPFANDTSSLNWATFTPARFAVISQSSSLNGYISGGGGFPYVTSIDKFPLTGQSDSTNVGNLSTAKGYGTGLSSATTGYTAGGITNPPITATNVIEKFPFATEVNSVSVATISFGRYSAADCSSNSSGYLSGGQIVAPPPAYIATIEKFSFSSDTNGTNVGSLTQAVGYAGGHNY